MRPTLGGLPAPSGPSSLPPRTVPSTTVALTPEQRKKTLTHPEFGVLDVDWLMVWAAGHERNHLPQIEAVAGMVSGEW